MEIVTSHAYMSIIIITYILTYTRAYITIIAVLLYLHMYINVIAIIILNLTVVDIIIRDTHKQLISFT